MTRDEKATWVSTTHDWATSVDTVHLDAIRAAPHSYAPGGVVQLVLEVLAYANDEAEALGRRGRAVVRMHADGSISVADDGRGTDTRRDANGVVIRKPVMATKDLRFFDAAPPVHLPDGRIRRGMSVVSALSVWLTHTNRRRDGAWTQRYEHGVPSSDLVDVAPAEQTGTTVRFQADRRVLPDPVEATPDRISQAAKFPLLDVDVTPGPVTTVGNR